MGTNQKFYNFLVHRLKIYPFTKRWKMKSRHLNSRQRDRKKFFYFFRIHFRITLLTTAYLAQKAPLWRHITPYLKILIGSLLTYDVRGNLPPASAPAEKTNLKYNARKKHFWLNFKTCFCWKFLKILCIFLGWVRKKQMQLIGLKNEKFLWKIFFLFQILEENSEYFQKYRETIRCLTSLLMKQVKLYMYAQGKCF